MLFAFCLPRLVTLLVVLLFGITDSSGSNYNGSLCDEWGRCAQTCSMNDRNKSLVQCGCIEGFRLDSNGASCVPLDSLASYLLITTNVGIQELPLDSKESSKFLYQSQTMTVAIDFLLNGSNTTVFWSDINTDQIIVGEIVNERKFWVRRFPSWVFLLVHLYSVSAVSTIAPLKMFMINRPFAKARQPWDEIWQPWSVATITKGLLASCSIAHIAWCQHWD